VAQGRLIIRCTDVDLGHTRNPFAREEHAMEWGAIICSIVSLGLALLVFVAYCEGKLEKMTNKSSAFSERSIHAA